MADEQTCEVGLTLVPLVIGPYSDEWLWIFRKYKTLENISLYNVKYQHSGCIKEKKFHLTRI
jgi:hypothetical protein